MVYAWIAAALSILSTAILYVLCVVSKDRNEKNDDSYDLPSKSSRKG